LIETVRAAEDNGVVPILGSEIYIYDNLIQRLGEFTHLQMLAEEGQNFGTLASNWVIDND
jgi:DNA polymerase III alpha subunit